MHYRLLSQCKLTLTHSDQHLQHPEYGPKIVRNSETRWKLLSHIKMNKFKRVRN